MDGTLHCPAWPVALAGAALAKQVKVGGLNPRTGLQPAPGAQRLTGGCHPRRSGVVGHG